MLPPKRRLPLALALFGALVAGVAQALSIALPGSGEPAWWLQLLSLATLVALLPHAVSWRQAALLGWVFATAWLCATFWWLFISMHTYGGLAAPLAALAVLGLAAFLALYYAAACASFWALGRTQTSWAAIIFVANWMLAELARNTWFTGFPWGAGGYAHVQGPLAALAPWVGVHGIGALAAAAAAGAALAVSQPGWRRVLLHALLPVAVLVLPLTLPAPQSASAGTLGVALLQGNIPQDEKFQAGTGVVQALRWYGEQLGSATAALVVAPETAIPMLPQQLPGDYWQSLLARFATGDQAALVGVPMGSLKDGYTNSAIGIKPGAPPYRFDKHHLVPFGEFIPPFFRWFTELMNIPLGDFNRGDVGQPSFEWRGQRLAPNICYEDLFGEELAARFADPARAPTMFVNLSNIGWFGDSLAIDQHLQISRMRALEFARPMIRATNTGATAVIDHRGEVLLSLPRLTRGVLVADVEGRTGLTPYARWASHLGLWPFWGLGAAVLVLAALLRRRAV